MQSKSPPIDLPDDLLRGVEMAAGEAGKSPTDVVVAALEQSGIKRLNEDQLLKRMTGSQ